VRTLTRIVTDGAGLPSSLKQYADPAHKMSTRPQRQSTGRDVAILAGERLR